MKAIITYSDGRDSRFETLETLEDLKNLIKKEKHPVIVNAESYSLEENCDLSIEVYNDYRE